MPDRYAVWLERDVVGASGPDAATFLQGQLSQDVLGLAEGGSAWSWLLAPTGKVDALLRVIHLGGDDWVLDTDAGWGEAVLGRLSRFKLRTKVELAARPWRVLGLRGMEGGSESRDGDGRDGEAVTVPAWSGLSGVDRLGPDLVVPEGWPVMSAPDYEAVRILAGFPRMGSELTDKTIPGETGLVDRTVSFTKGCYTGQELVARIDSRGGHVPRHLRILRLSAEVQPGAALVDEAGGDAGTVTSVAHSPEAGWVALGYVRRAVDDRAPLRAGEGGPQVVVQERPG
jgi:tRNA-modifying protein YgfZ